MPTININGKEYYEGDLFIWRTRNREENPLEVGYLYYDEDDEWYIGDEFAYPNATGFDPLYVVGYGMKVGNISDMKNIKSLW